MSDVYKTLKNLSQGSYKEKGSKFIAFAQAVETEDEIKEIRSQLRKDYFDARHHCYAWRLGANLERFRAIDDGEPSSSAGKPILGQIQSFGLSNILIVVIRYFGGTKLGVSGLIKAYRTAATDAIKNGEIIEKTVNDIIQVSFDYLAMNDVMKIIKDVNAKMENQNFDNNCTITLSIRQSNSSQLIDRFEKIDLVSIEKIGVK